MTYTEGPWRTNRIMVRARNGQQIALTYQPNARENAKLTAAAPDLLKALRAMVRIEEGHDPDDRNITDTALREYNKLIASAEGAE